MRPVTSTALPARSPPYPLAELIAGEIQAHGGWLPFDRFMHLALYAPGLGYYAHGSAKFGHWPDSGSDFVTAPELSPLFGRALAAQVAQSLAATGTRQVWEFGAGSGALAGQLIDALAALGQPLESYTIVDVSSALRARQQARLARFGERVRWASRLPKALRGVVIGNEVLDAMPVKLLARRGGKWLERGVALADEKWREWQQASSAGNAAGPHPSLPPEGEGARFPPPLGEGRVGASSAGSHPDSVNDSASSPIPFIWQDRPTPLRPPVDIGGEHDYVTEIHLQARAFIATLAEKLLAGGAGAAYFIDYGFPEAEYWHPDRSAGTLMCHRAHRADDDPLAGVGSKDITAHVDFTGIALAAQQAGLDVLGYASQGRFLINCGIAPFMQAATLPDRATAMKLLAEHEMGELFKVIGFAPPGHGPALGFAEGDRTHRL